MGLENKNNSDLNRRRFARKPYSKFLYTWTPFEDNGKAKKKTNQPNLFCNAKPNTNGEDFVTTYVYDQENINGVIHKYGYVECDYVQ